MAVFLVFASFALFYFLGYRGWSRILARKVFALREDEPTPAHDPDLQDGVDYLPVKGFVLWGHHYTSIAGAAPIVGPAVAVFWGWAPALFWIVFGTIFIGAVHDFGTLVISTRNRGRTMGDLAGVIITPRTRLLFQTVIYFLIWIVLAVFGFVIGVLFTKYPATVLPINFQIVVAIAIGWMAYKKKVKLLWPSLVALVLLYAMIPVGLALPVEIRESSWLIGGDPFVTWAVILIVYAGIASVLPVWFLLQPRDFINSHQLIVGLLLLVLGLVFLNPEMAAPALRLNPEGAPPLLPFLFVTIACGAISGFHGLVSSGTTSKQLDSMKDARRIGYGGMLGEGSLAVIATIAVAAGLKNWDVHYHDWNASGVLAIEKFVLGSGSFLEALGFNERVGHALVAVLVIAFAATSMDTAARIQRMVVSEAGKALGIGFLQNRYLATILAVGPAIPLVLLGKKAWGPLWMLFGTTNQLIGAMSFLLLFVYLYRGRRPLWQVGVPLIFVTLVTTVAMVLNLVKWTSAALSEAQAGAWLTVGMGAAILLLEVWMMVEAVLVLRRLRKSLRTN